MARKNLARSTRDRRDPERCRMSRLERFSVKWNRGACQLFGAIPAKAGVQYSAASPRLLDPRFRGDYMRRLFESTRTKSARVARTAILVLSFGAALSISAFAQDAAQLAAGEEAWDKAGCLQCHGSSGEGGAGGEFPAGPSLRKAKLDRVALTETISCGLPGTQMPGWLDGAYTQRSCYGFPNGPAPAGTDLSPVLNANEIEALVDYLLAKVVGH